MKPPLLDCKVSFARLIGCTTLLILSLAIPSIRAADEPSRSALEMDPQGWVDIMPPADLSGWVSVPCKTGAKVTRMQWHMDNGLLTCDGDGGHDMLLLNR